MSVLNSEMKLLIERRRRQKVPREISFSTRSRNRRLNVIATRGEFDRYAAGLWLLS
jgi:hypothetical protein